MKPSIGILGLGYLGQEIARQLGQNRDFWFTTHRAGANIRKDDVGISQYPFLWDIPETWKNLPDREAILVITIPPVHQDVLLEYDHLQSWCQWLTNHRKGFSRVIYISSTGVYPNLPGIWHEEAEFQPDSGKGALRLAHEKAFLENFESSVIRSGAIYGRERNIGRRILAGKPIPKGSQPIHRIHVQDLARLVILLTENNDTKVVNAVDLKPETSKEAADWLIRQPFFPTKTEIEVVYQQEFQTRKFNLSEPNRKIDNQLLVNKLGFNFMFPTYKEGLRHSFQDGK